MNERTAEEVARVVRLEEKHLGGGGEEERRGEEKKGEKVKWDIE
jgi:hypothetical protein